MITTNEDGEINVTLGGEVFLNHPDGGPWSRASAEAFLAAIPTPEPAPPPPPPTKRLVSKSLWLNELNLDESRAFAQLERQANALSDEAFDVTPQEDMQTYLLTCFAAFLFKLDKLGDYIDLLDQSVIEGFHLFAGLIGMSSEREMLLLDYE